jgi:uridylate kinase
MRTIILSLGGSIIVPNEVDYFFLKEFKNFIIKYIKKQYKFIIFCGGGRTNTKYNTAAKRVSIVNDENLDWLGIMASRLNAELIRVIFGELTHKKVIYNPSKKIITKKPIIVAAGWKPGWSTDYDAVLFAKKMKVNELINLTNVSYVYNKNPRKFQNAKILKEITWKKFRKIVGSKWSPRLSSPFDPIASKEAQKNKLKVVIMKGTDLENLERYLKGKEFQGTVIN